MDDLQKILEQKADQLNVDQKLTELEVIEGEIKRFLPKVRASVPKIYPGRKALVITPDGHSASEIKFSQIAILQSLNNILSAPLKDLVVIVR